MARGVIVALDIGGTRIRSACAAPPYTLSAQVSQPTPATDFHAFIGALRAAVRGTPVAAGISIAGAVDPVTGRARVANIPCLDGRHVAADLAAALGFPVIVANDADCFALAEAVAGAGRGHRTVFGAILGTGVGGGLVVDGKLVAGAGEWGHGPVTQPAFPCGCGLAGCLDAIGSARGIERLHVHLGGAPLAAPDLLARWTDGDAQAARTVAAWLDVLAGPLAMVVNVTGADIVPTGGGLAGAPGLLAALDAAVRPLTLARPDRPLVVPATSGPEPGLTGAAILALELSRS